MESLYVGEDVHCTRILLYTLFHLISIVCQIAHPTKTELYIGRFQALPPALTNEQSPSPESMDAEFFF